MSKTHKTTRFTVLALLAGFIAFVNADQIVLQDGSTINGEVISLQSGSYQIRTDSLGVVTLQKDQVRSISQGAGSYSGPVPSAGGPSPGGVSPSAVQSIQSSLTSDPGMMSRILQLQSDPDMQAVLNDPELMSAIQSFDLEAIRNHPKIRKLMGNSTVQSIQDKVN